MQMCGKPSCSKTMDAGEVTPLWERITEDKITSLQIFSIEVSSADFIMNRLCSLVQSPLYRRRVQCDSHEGWIQITEWIRVGFSSISHSFTNGCGSYIRLRCSITDTYRDICQARNAVHHFSHTKKKITRFSAFSTQRNAWLTGE